MKLDALLSLVPKRKKKSLLCETFYDEILGIRELTVY